MQRENLKVHIRERVEDTVCDLSLSELSEIPVKEIASFKRVTTLDLSSNRLVVIYDNIALLNRLVKLDLSKNKINSLPNAIGQLEQLRHLDLYDNRLEHLPITFANLRRLRYLDLKGNPLSAVWQKVVGHCITTQDCQQAAKNTVKMCAAALEREKVPLNLGNNEKVANAQQNPTSNAQKSSKSSKKNKNKHKKSAANNDNNELTIKEVVGVAAQQAGNAANATATNRSANSKRKSNYSRQRSCGIFKNKMHALVTILVFSAMVIINLLIIYSLMFKNPETANRLVEYIPQQYRDWIVTKTEIFRLGLSDWISQFRTPPEEH